MKKKANKNFIVFIATVLIITAAVVAFAIFSNVQKKPIYPENCNHNFTEIKREEADEFTPGKITYKCSKCDEEKTERINALGELPQIYFDGSIQGIGKDSDVLVKVEYTDQDQNFDSFATIKYQGHTAMLYDKKNFTVKFYKDDKKEEKNKVSLNGWKESNKYCLKANYIDFSQSRNIVSANIWTDVVNSRKKLDANIADLQYYGAIDGYPIMVFINDEYQGVYTMNIPKDNDTYNIGDNENEALFVINSPNSESSYFKANLTEEDKKNIFDLEYCYGEDDENTDWAYESLDNLISFVINSDGKDFKNGISKYLDVDSAIDYLVTTYYLGLTDNFAKNVLMLTYNGEQWILSLYDMDTAFGLAFDGTKLYSPDYLLPKRNAKGELTSSTGSLLWDKLLINYYDEIKERYSELRKTTLNNDRVISRYEDFINTIPKEYYDKDLEIWENIPLHKKNNITQMKEFLDKRSKLLDEFFEL